MRAEGIFSKARGTSTGILKNRLSSLAALWFLKRSWQFRRRGEGSTAHLALD